MQINQIVVTKAWSAVALSGLLLALGTGVAQAAEISLLTGLYQSEKSQYDGSDSGGKSTVGVGGRFSDAVDQHLHWFGQGQLTMRSYDAPAGGKAPSNSTSLAAGGGVRYYFGALSERVYPFIAALGEFRNEKNVEFGDHGAFDENEANGLYYSGLLGLRLTLDTDFFFDFETLMFQSALFASESSRRTTCREATTTSAGGCSKSPETETDRMDLYVDTRAAFMYLAVGVGMKL